MSVRRTASVIYTQSKPSVSRAEAPLGPGGLSGVVRRSSIVRAEQHGGSGPQMATDGHAERDRTLKAAGMWEGEREWG